MKKLTFSLVIGFLFSSVMAQALEFRPLDFRYWRYSNTQDGDFFSRFSFGGTVLVFRVQAMNESVADRLEAMRINGTHWTCQAKNQILSGSNPVVNVFELKDCQAVQD